VSTGTESIWTPDGHERILNLQPSDPRKLHRYRATPFPTIPLDKVQEFDDWPSEVQYKDQDGAGACNGHATATFEEYLRALAGMPYVALSAWYIYGMLVHGRDVGSNITDALELIQSKGVAPESDVKYGDFSGNYQATTHADASRFTCEIGGSLTEWEEIVSVVALRGACNMSVRANDGWSRGLDSDGCPPVGRGPGNHAVMVGGGIKRLANGEVAIRMTNSWGAKWGLGGYCWLKRAHWEAGTWRECIFGRAVARDPKDVVPVAA
jgi:hypothetical protein